MGKRKRLLIQQCPIKIFTLKTLLHNYVRLLPLTYKNATSPRKQLQHCDSKSQAIMKYVKHDVGTSKIHYKNTCLTNFYNNASIGKDDIL